MDRVEGFKMFLTAVDSDRLQTIARPDKTPQLFERFLPYAFALGVEHAWAQQFSQVLAQAATAGGAGGSASILLRGIPARLWRHFRRRILRRASAVRFPALSRRLPLLQDHLRAREAAVRPAAVVVAGAAAVGKPLRLRD